jgi:ABC-type uncharacterized transport system permease subunit
MTSPQELLHAGLAIVTAALYLYAGARQLLTLDARQTGASQRVLWIASFAVSCHLLLSAMDWVQGNLDLGFYKISSLIFLLMGSVSLISMLLRPLHMLIIATFPLSALAVLVNHFAPATGQPMAGLPDGLLVHVSTSLLAFGVLTLGTFQGILVSIQTQRLRSHKTRGIIRMLPPLDTMEQMFYELLFAGTALLTVAILTGGIFIDDLLGQKLVHKTVLTSLGWALMSTTLFVHWRRGWRIGTALTLVFVGYALLALGFFGSKLVVELLL